MAGTKLVWILYPFHFLFLPCFYSIYNQALKLKSNHLLERQRGADAG